MLYKKLFRSHWGQYLLATLVLTLTALLSISYFKNIALFIVYYNTQILGSALMVLIIAILIQHKQNVILKENKKLYIELQRKQNYIERDMSMARKVQQGMLNIAIPQIKGYSFGAFCIPAEKIGGDFFKIVKKEKLIHLYVGDVTGHGISSALLMSLANGYLHDLSKNEDSPAKILTALNKQLLAVLQDSFSFITMFYAVLDPSKSTLVFASAGHHPALLLNKSLNITPLNSPATMLGVFEKTGYKNKTHQLHPGDKVFLYTDGILEGRDQNGTELGEDYWHKLLQKTYAKKGPALIKALLKNLQATNHTIRDDISLVVLEKN